MSEQSDKLGRQCFTGPLMLVVFVAFSAVNTFAAENTGKTTTAPRAVSALIREATPAAHRGERWPRANAEYARIKRLRMSSDDVIRLLSKPLNRHAALAAYVKWQLMSFEPDLSQVDVETFGRIIATMPKVHRQPEPQLQPRTARNNMNLSVIAGRQIAFISDIEPIKNTRGFKQKLSVVNTGSALSFDQDEPGPFQRDREVSQANERLESMRERTTHSNEPVLAYRDALMPSLPTKGGVRLAAMAKDVYDRVAAGDPSARPAMKRLINECRKLMRDPHLTVEHRRNLSNEIIKLRGLRTKVVQGIELNDRDKIAFRGVRVYIPQRDVTAALAYLSDIEPTVARGD